MVKANEQFCPCCGGKLRYYDNVPRIILTKRREMRIISLRRLRCLDCRKVHREIPDIIFPYKQYEAEVIIGFKEGLITSETLGFEDYPSETTIRCWLL